MPETPHAPSVTRIVSPGVNSIVSGPGLALACSRASAIEPVPLQESEVTLKVAAHVEFDMMSASGVMIAAISRYLVLSTVGHLLVI